MNNFVKLSNYYKTYGLMMTLLKAKDAIFKTNDFSQCVYDKYKSANPEDYPELLKKFYYFKTGKKLNLDNPKTFNEKIQWLKLYDNTPIKTILADKYLARNWIKEKIGEEYLVPLLGVYERFEDINFEKLPEKFALKCNHGSGYNLIVTDKNKIDYNDAKLKFDNWLKTNYAFTFGFELQYLNIHPCIIAEKYLEIKDGIKDYRFYCFNGTPVQIWVDIYSGTPAHLRSIFDMDWKKVPVICKWPDGGQQLETKPKTFDEMKELATVLSSDFAFVRVDFFEVQNKIYMGEMTFTPMSGMGEFDPPEWDYKLGSLLKLPNES